ncbi:MAG TPA: inosine/xanthosine triphosphatase [Conexivisphaerales archaeon]|nr:inosine/xanthosine triphosphatase [Conexivisphaerales archaeon]
MKPRVTVAVGSTNSVKVQAAKKAFEPYFEAEVVGMGASSGVGPQPLGGEAFEGARNRAVNAMRLARSDFAVGLEGGIIELDGRRFGFAAVSIVDAKGNSSFATTGLFPLPRDVLKLVEEGLELGDAMDRVTGLSDVKHGPGAVGILTKGVIDRTALYAHGTTLALIPHLNRHFSW